MKDYEVKKVNEGYLVDDKYLIDNESLMYVIGAIDEVEITLETIRQVVPFIYTSTDAKTLKKKIFSL